MKHMSNGGKFVLFCIGIVVLAMMAGGSNTRGTFTPAPTPASPNCYFQSEASCSALGSFYRALDASEERARK